MEIIQDVFEVFRDVQIIDSSRSDNRKQEGAVPRPVIRSCGHEHFSVDDERLHCPFRDVVGDFHIARREVGRQVGPHFFRVGHRLFDCRTGFVFVVKNQTFQFLQNLGMVCVPAFDDFAWEKLFLPIERFGMKQLSDDG